jgi:hypothetical protein
MKSLIVLLTTCLVGCIGSPFTEQEQSADTLHAGSTQAQYSEEQDAQAGSCVLIHAAWSSATTYATSIPAVCPVNTFATGCGCDTSGYGVVPAFIPSNAAGAYNTGVVPTECRCVIATDDAGVAGSVASVAICCGPDSVLSYDGGLE